MNDEMVHHLKEVEDVLQIAYRGKLRSDDLKQLIGYVKLSGSLSFALGRVHGISEVKGV